MADERKDQLEAGNAGKMGGCVGILPVEREKQTGTEIGDEMIGEEKSPQGRSTVG